MNFEATLGIDDDFTVEIVLAVRPSPGSSTADLPKQACADLLMDEWFLQAGTSSTRDLAIRMGSILDLLRRHAE
jgi:hypothetical protein